MFPLRTVNALWGRGPEGVNGNPAGASERATTVRTDPARTAVVYQLSITGRLPQPTEGREKRGEAGKARRARRAGIAGRGRGGEGAAWLWWWGTQPGQARRSSLRNLPRPS